MRNTRAGVAEQIFGHSRAGGPGEPTGTEPTTRARRRRVVQTGTTACALGAAFFAGVLVGDDGTAPTAGAAAELSAPAPVPAPVATPTPTPTPTPAPGGPPQEAAAATAPVQGALQVSIPDLGIDQRMIGLDILPDGRLEAPEVFDDIGWWSDGPAPGDPGAAIVVGHVDSTEGPAVFYELSTLKVGDVVSFTRSDGSVVRFAVTGTQRFAKDAFPDDLVYRLDGKPSVHLVTCGGVFDRETGHYRDNVVVFADLIEEAPTGTATASGPAADAGTGEGGTR